MKNVLLLAFLLGLNHLVRAQARVKDSLLFAPLFGVSYSYQLSGGDLAKRFGNNSNVGAMLLVTTKKNLLYCSYYSFLLTYQFD